MWEVGDICRMWHLVLCFGRRRRAERDTRRVSISDWSGAHLAFELISRLGAHNFSRSPPDIFETPLISLSLPLSSSNNIIMTFADTSSGRAQGDGNSLPPPPRIARRTMDRPSVLRRCISLCRLLDRERAEGRGGLRDGEGAGGGDGRGGRREGSAVHAGIESKGGECLNMRVYFVESFG